MITTKKLSIAIAMLVGLLTLASLPIQAAEDFPRSEIFGGYTYSSIDTTFRNTDRLNAHGWALSLNGNVNKFFGVTFDMGGHYGTVKNTILSTNPDFRVFEFLFGPTVSARADKVTGFAHFLMGPSRMSVDFGRSTATQTKFSMGVGGGVDFNINKNFAIRGVEVDYLPIRLGKISDLSLATTSAWSQNFRLKTGFVFKF